MTLQEITAQPGFKTALHSHPQPGIAYVVRGTLSCKTTEGKLLKVVSVNSFATPQETLHYCKNDGDDVALIIVASAGVKGKSKTSL